MEPSLDVGPTSFILDGSCMFSIAKTSFSGMVIEFTGQYCMFSLLCDVHGLDSQFRIWTVPSMGPLIPHASAIRRRACSRNLNEHKDFKPRSFSQCLVSIKRPFSGRPP